MAQPFFTIGHSTRSMAEFAELLHSSSVSIVADVRSIPRSRANPQFGREQLADSLAELQIGYVHFAPLGGLRGKQPASSISANQFWRVNSFRNYADYALGAEFRASLGDLQALGRDRRIAIMCAEAVWWRCHRRIIADYLLAAGESVFHILSTKNVAPARLTPGAMLTPEGQIIYPGGQAALGHGPRPSR